MKILIVILTITISLIANELTEYENSKFGFMGKYPSSIFVNKLYSDNVDGIILSNKNNKVKCTFSGLNNTMEENLKDEYEFILNSAKNSKKEVTYKILRKKWYVISGYNHTNNAIFYQKRFLSNKNLNKESVFSGFSLEYPIEDKKKYDNLVRVINKHFKPAISPNVQNEVLSYSEINTIEIEPRPMNSIGFKGMYLNDNKDEACKIVKQYADKYEQNYQMNIKDNYCFTQKTQRGTYMTNFNPTSDFLIVRFDNNKVKKIRADGFWTDKLFESSNLRQKELVQELLDNIDWLTELNVKTQNFLGNIIHHYVQKTRSWEFKISPSKRVELTKLKIKNFK